MDDLEGLDGGFEFDLRTPEERRRDFERYFAEVARINQAAEERRHKTRIKRAAAAVPKYLHAARAAGLSVASVVVHDDGSVSVIAGEPVAAPEVQGRSRLDDLLGT